ncbi:hypothetical protein C0033_14110 [Clostridium sp. chh4-2]|uniref:DUF4132 domain-containing protein n=1 Tax=Clostridium sp. chh4-2 TaxID=2067550 RepID=UPI000CCEA692|nr:DUF4132 domain-containing protein [Clostridium sp. chh4-2]PNV61422.1 hypothetical protein C0033_14110 [Clostridium sp. chh4-2]
MEYNGDTRLKLVEDFKKKWNKKLLLAGSGLKKQVKEVEQMGTYRAEPDTITPEALEYCRQETITSYGELMKKHYGKLTEFFAGKKYSDDYYYIVDKLNRFPYSETMYRRTVRTKRYFPQISHVFILLRDYRMFQFFECSVADYLLDRMAPEKLDYKRNSIHGFTMKYFDDIIAARIDLGDRDVIEAVRELILSDNNTAVLTVDVIRGIIKSSDSGLHQLLADFLLAARLQEGVRQAVCENADCGTVEAFVKIFDTICDNNLIRFAAVKRAVATWTGICDLENVDRITEKMAGLMQKSIKDVSVAREYLKTNDTIQIAIGLWTLGSYELQDAIDAMMEYLESGTRNQLLTMSYFNRTLDWSRITSVTAKAAVKKFADDEEIVAAFFPTYLEHAQDCAYKALNYNENRNKTEKVYKEIPLSELFDSEEEAREHYGILKNILDGMTKKKREFYPCIFPWYGVALSRTQIIKRMCVIAYALKDEACMEEMAEKLPLLDTSEGYASRGLWVELLLHSPSNERQKNLLIRYIADKESSAREKAFQIADKLTLSAADYEQLEGFLKYKSGDIRRNVLKLLEKQPDDLLIPSVKRLLGSSQEEIRDGGLSLIIQAKKSERSQELKEKLVCEARNAEMVTDKEQILINEITENEKSDQEEGYGLYQPDFTFSCPVRKPDLNVIQSYFSVSGKDMNRVVNNLIALIGKNAEAEYKNTLGNEVLLGNGLVPIAYGSSLPFEDRYPFKEMWVRFYEEEVKDPHLLKMLLLASNNAVNVYGGKIKRREKLDRYLNMLLGSSIMDYRLPAHRYTKGGYNSTVNTVFMILNERYPENGTKEAALELAYEIVEKIPKEDLWYEIERDKGYYYSTNCEYPLSSFPVLLNVLNTLKDWKDDEEFGRNFMALYLLDEKFDFSEHREKSGVSYNRQTGSFLSIYYYIKACILGLVPMELVYQAAFTKVGLCVALEDLSRLVMDTMTVRDKVCLSRFLSKKELEEEKLDQDSPFVKLGRQVYFKITDMILDVELKRGEMATAFSDSVPFMKRIFGLERLAQILKALGNDKLDRGTYYYWSGSRSGRKECLSYLLQICYPREDDNAEKMQEIFGKSRIKEQKIIETAMYAPQWLSMIEEYLGWPGLKSGCYYFMAHMNERFDDKKAAMIAKYTPLSPEDLNNGAFDVSWFKEAYGLLGEERFQRLYDAAKYISDGSKHARARKYSDAALGKVTTEELVPVIQDKRNKDLLMSYGLVPIADKADLLDRYEFLQKFLKESRQFGAQRRASEALAVATALKNMATTAGYADVTRLTLAMESELIKTYQPYFEEHEEEGVTLQLSTDEYGKTEIICKKGGKAQKTVPSKLKKQEYYLKLKEIEKKLKDQHSRTVKMFEQSMEEQELYRYQELNLLCENPVIEPVIRSLVFITGEENPVHGWMMGEGLMDCFGEIHPLAGEAQIRIAHPYDLYRSGCWHEYQKMIFAGAREGGIKKQPFKQVFRELYVKLPEELEKERSTMFAGNQIQPSKTVACLKRRRWIADYEEGLQKVYYKENLIAHIYALADWFSPSDIEAPTLEWVEFCDRKTFNRVKIQDIPDIVYSEVMRDVDLAVSVAHAGGVDPETSHSTMEMRRAVLEFSLPLFKLTNVRLEGSHAFVEGARGSYSIHLGSGVIHQAGGHQINVLPVHSQGRGKLFLPFLDEDPKTAEIISKVVMFAEDKKLKDPYILDQIAAL